MATDEQYVTMQQILFLRAMKGEWEEVIEMYKDGRLHDARITRSGQTALHIAVSDGKEEAVKQMVQIMSSRQPSWAEAVRGLRTQDHSGGTALHYAASIGNATICDIIASVEPTLVDDRNGDGETPLFLAALHGRKQAFLCLHYIRNPNITTSTSTTPPLYVNCRRNNGDTILHSAINGDYFDLAFQIIHLYKELVNWVNEDGLSPLHLLASKPCAFKSGSRLGRIETIIYHCIYVEKLKAEYPEFEGQKCPISAANKDSDRRDCPENYNTLWDVFCLIRRVLTVVVARRHDDARSDAETGGVYEGDRANPLFPVNYATCCNLVKIILTKGSKQLRRNIYRKKETHTWSVQIVKKLLDCASLYEYENDGRNPNEAYSTMSLDKDIIIAPFVFINKGDEEPGERRMKERSPILVAAKNGVVEIIEKIVELFPVASLDMNEEKKNVVLLAVEHRQPHVYEFFLKKEDFFSKNLFHKVDKNGNTTLHLAATIAGHKPWLISGEALQMQWELKWYEFVKKTMPPGFICPYNKHFESPDEIFTRTHCDLVTKGGEWLRKTSESCSVVATLVATVAFATSTTLPGGVNQTSGYPVLEKEAAFDVFATTSLIALCCSVMAVITFLSLLTSRMKEQDFHKDLPMRLLLGLTLLLLSISSMLISFCAGHFFVLKHRLYHAGFALYAVTCFAVISYVLAQFPLYFDYLRATFVRIPQRS